MGPVYALFCLGHVPPLTRRLALVGRGLANPAVQALLLVAAGGGLIVAAVVMSEPSQGEDFGHLTEEPSGGAPSFRELEGLSATTDRGQTIKLLVPQNPADVDNPAEQERARRLTGAYPLIQTGPAESTINCHGWVFAMGQAWISGAVVDSILVDNGYLATRVPAVGDVVVYRDPAGATVHSGIVRGTSGDGRALVESKWGALGTYVHAVHETMYGDRFTFYHSDRPGHLLRGLPRPSHGSAGTRQN